MDYRSPHTIHLPHMAIHNSPTPRKKNHKISDYSETSEHTLMANARTNSPRWTPPTTHSKAVT
ncbi:hypothetical protein C9890_0253 [Perkinsus sp. BL_2016]|nr:hypothetical protein C9890_0253 [Perkinsus sp. BL_2016]